jgi:hypothetical protein
VVHELAQFPSLSVIVAPSSVEGKEDRRAMGVRLQAANLLEGSVQQVGDSLHVTTSLIAVGTGRLLLSRTYDRQQRDLFALQKELARDVAIALSVRLDVGVIRSNRGGTTNFDAWDRTQQAMFLWRQGTSETAERALRLAREAVQLDDKFSLGWYRVWMLSPPGPDADAAEKRFLALAPDAWWSRQQQVVPLLVQRKWADAVALVKSIMDEGPLTFVDLERSRPNAMVLGMVGQIHVLAEQAQTVVEIEPRGLLISVSLQARLDQIERPDRAVAEYQRSLSLTGDHSAAHYMQLLRLLRNPASPVGAVRSQYQRLLAEPGAVKGIVDTLDRLAKAHGDAGAVRAILVKAAAGLDKSGTGSMAAMLHLADAYGDAPLATQILGKLLMRPDWSAYFELWAPYRTPLRGSAQFKDLMVKMRLVDYWRSSGKWADLCKPVGDNDFECR